MASQQMPKTLFGFYELTIKEYWVQILAIFLLNTIYYAGGSIIIPLSIKMVIGSIETAVAGGHDVFAAARAARAHGFIMNCDDGYKTVVGDRGVKLSGGQRQRITIAHAILKNAPILILDEATSALDSETESAISESFNRLMKNRTTIAIAHRLSTLKQMDRIIVLDKGHIAEVGTHSDLISRPNGIYAKLWSMQSDGFIQ